MTYDSETEELKVDETFTPESGMQFTQQELLSNYLYASKEKRSSYDDETQKRLNCFFNETGQRGGHQEEINVRQGNFIRIRTRPSNEAEQRKKDEVDLRNVGLCSISPPTLHSSQAP